MVHLSLGVAATFIIAGIIAGALIFLGVLIWLNNGSEKILSVALPAVAAAVVVATAAVFFSLKSEVFEDDIPVILVAERETLQLGLHVLNQQGGGSSALPNFGYNMYAGITGQAMLKAFPEIKDGDPSKAADLYGKILMRTIAVRLFWLFPMNWDRYYRRMSYPGGGEAMMFGTHPDFPAGPSLAADPIPWSDAKHWFPENETFSVGHDVPLKLGVPRGTRITGQTGEYGGQTLTFKNPLSEVRIELINTGFGILTIPEDIVAIPDSERERFVQMSYFIRVAAKFDRWRSSHTDMEKHQRWVRNIASLLHDQFDSSRQWDRAKEAFFVAAANRALHQPSPVPAQTATSKAEKRTGHSGQ